jgi:chitinase
VLVPLSAHTVGDLFPGGGSSTTTTIVQIPPSTRPGEYVIEACADADLTTFESNEANNCASTDLVSVPTPAVSIRDASKIEGNAGTVAMSFAVSLSVPSASPVSVQYATTDGTAKAPADYVATSGTVNFAPGETSKTATVLVKGDVLDEPTETLKVNLSNPSGATIGDGTAVGRILDDDPLPSVRINNVQATEGNSGTKNFTFHVSLSAVSGRAVRVNWNTVDGTARAGTDYVAAHGTLVIPAGATGGNVVVRVIGDRIHEPNETFKVVLSTPTAATIAGPTGQGTILNDD